MRFSLLSPVFLFFVCLNAVSQSFSPQILTSSCPEKPAISFVDVDADGKKDIVLAYSYSDKFSWIRNLGNSNFGPPLPIQTPDTVNLVHGCFADMDQDGKEDLISVQNTSVNQPIVVVNVGDKLVWQKNEGNGSFGGLQLISQAPSLNFSSPLLFRKNVVSKDLNSDGIPDFIVNLVDYSAGCIILNYTYILTSNAPGDYWFTLNSQPDFESYQLEPIEGVNYGEWAFVNVLCYSSWSDGVFVQTPDTMGFGFAPLNKILSFDPAGLGSSYMASLVSQGNLTGNSKNELLTYIKPYNSTVFKLGYFINPGSSNATYHSVHVGSGTLASLRIDDYDGDGLSDILATKDNMIIWYKNLGQGLFSQPKVLVVMSTQITSLSTTDPDQDSDLDLIGYSASGNKIFYLENGGGTNRFVSGQIFLDPDHNCQNEQLGYVNNFSILRFLPGNYLAAAYGNQPFYRELPSGNFSTQLVTKWPGLSGDTICGNPSLNFTLDSSQIFQHLNVGLQGNNCAQVRVIASSDNRIPCRKTTSSFTITNEGLGSATSLTLRVKLPATAEFLGYTSSSSGTHSVDNQTNEHLFNLNSLPGFGSQFITIQDLNVCDASTVGSQQCLSAKVEYSGKCHPDAPAWDHSDMVVTSECTGDGSAVFQIHNTGTGSMSDSNTYRIYTAAGITNTGKYKLQVGESMWISVPDASNIFHLVADQSPNHPLGKFATGFIQPCVPHAILQAYNTTFVYSGQNSDIGYSELCKTVLGSLDPNDKQVYPEGWGVEGNVQSQTRFQYRVRFQNTGTAEAHYVQIRDTLSEHLDITSLMGIDGSFPYNRRFELSGTLDKPILIFTFENIVLPDSNTSKEGSQGFVTFSIAAKPGLSQQTQIRNEATIYFDINPGVRTNTVVNTINDSIPNTIPVILSVSRPLVQTDFQVVPNPTSGRSKVFFGRPVSGRLQVFDLQGKCWMDSQVSGSQTEPIMIPSVKKGLFVVRFLSEDGAQSQQKLLVEYSGR